MNTEQKLVLSKVPEVTFLFWVIKVLCTTLGETGGDALSMSMDLGYLISTGIFAVIFAATVSFQIFSRKFHPVTYWVTIIATTTVGTTLADLADRSLRIGYAGGTTILLLLLLAWLGFWKYTLGSVAVDSVKSRQSEIFYWITILCSQTLGTALGDWTADTAGIGYGGGIFIFGGILAMIAAAYFLTKISRTVLFWAAFILTRPLGAVVGDFLDKPRQEGGLAMSRYAATAILLSLIAIFVFIFPQKAAAKSLKVCLKS